MLENRGQGTAAGIASDFGVVVETGGGPFDFVAVFAVGLAAFEGHGGGEIFLLLPQSLRNAMQHGPTFNGRNPPPFLESLTRRTDRSVCSPRIPARNLPDDRFSLAGLMTGII